MVSIGKFEDRLPENLTDEQREALKKYDKHGPFNEPVVRCDACQELLLVSDLHEHGMCTHCGNTRVRNVRTLSGEEMDKVRKWGDEGKLNHDWMMLWEVA